MYTQQWGARKAKWMRLEPGGTSPVSGLSYTHAASCLWKAFETPANLALGHSGRRSATAKVGGKWAHSLMLYPGHKHETIRHERRAFSHCDIWLILQLSRFWHTICCIQDTNMKWYTSWAPCFFTLWYLTCLTSIEIMAHNLLYPVHKHEVMYVMSAVLFHIVISDLSYNYQDSGTQFAVSRTQTWSDIRHERRVFSHCDIWLILQLWR